jgi:hypothetical protein
MEAKLQKKIIDWLKANGVYVIKTRVLPGVPVGCPDIIGLYLDTWLAIEVKAKPKAPFRPGQQATLQHLKKSNTFVYVVNPENWDSIKDEIVTQFF